MDRHTRKSQRKTPIMKTKNTLDKRDIDGYTVLHRAILDNNIETIIELLKKGSNVNKTDYDRNNALHLAVLVRDINKVSVILRYFPEISKKNADGNTPLHIAVINGDINIIYALLLKGGCNALRIKNYDGKTPLSIAEDSHIETIRNNIAIYMKNMCEGPIAAGGSRSNTKKNRTKKQKSKTQIKYK
jgi:ankyrin repeat protein